MAIFRNIELDLERWVEDKNRKPLLVRGPRQVGKTYIIEKFGKKNFRRMIKVNFEREPMFCEVFESMDPNKIISALELITNIKVGGSDTLIFLDEIQECPKAIMALRYFKEERQEVPVIGAGSLLEFTLNDENFKVPVGRVQYLYMSPITFDEFLIASGHSNLYEYLGEFHFHYPIEEVIHQKLLRLVREYMILGGMPEVLKDYFERGNLKYCQHIQTDLLATYRSDFGKFAKKSQHKYLQALFEKAPGLIAQWFKYVKVDPDIPSRELKAALHMLCDAGIVQIIHATAASGLPLASTMNAKKFKLLFLDVGLVQRSLHLDIEMLIEKDLLLINRGALAEQFVGQQLLGMMNKQQKPELYFWVRENPRSCAEVDFVMNIGSQIIPIEVKAGATGRLKSLLLLLHLKHIPLGIRVSAKKLSLERNILSIPFYMVHQLPRLLAHYTHVRKAA